MDKTKGIYWLASYPKSGNTWFRIVLSNLLNKTLVMDNLEHIDTGIIASSRMWIDNILGFESASLTPDELEQLLPKVYQYQHEHSKELGYHKIHNAYTFLDKKKTNPLIPPESFWGAIYLVRNPLDVAVSYAKHCNCSLDQSIAIMGDEKQTLSPNIFGQDTQIRHKLGSWSSHVESWINTPGINVLTIRYEDMKTEPLETFARAMNFLQVPTTAKELSLAIENARIERLRELEEQFGFKERPIKAERFFRKGIVGDWKEQLSPAQVRRIVRDHGIVMQKQGYLTDSLINFF